MEELQESLEEELQWSLEEEFDELEGSLDELDGSLDELKDSLLLVQLSVESLDEEDDMGKRPGRSSGILSLVWPGGQEFSDFRIEAEPIRRIAARKFLSHPLGSLPAEGPGSEGVRFPTLAVARIELPSVHWGSVEWGDGRLLERIVPRELAGE